MRVSIQRHRVIIAVGLLVLGSLLAWFVQTDGGGIDVSQVTFAGSHDNAISALLYVPRGVSSTSPAPAVLAIHGYINSKETQSGFAIEFARHGFVVLAPDQTGHGYSDPPAFSDGFGGPAALRYLRSLPFVDTRRIGLEGHSMGGWAVQMAAASNPGGYSAMVLEGSSTGTFGTPEGTPTVPRNLLLVYSRFDEFSSFMWGAKTPRDILHIPKLEKLFGTRTPVVPGKLYGDPAKGTARELLMPAVTHPGDHLSREAIGDAVDWFVQRLQSNSRTAPRQQIWYWKSFGTLVALVGLMVLLFPLVDWLLSLPWFGRVVTGPPHTPHVPVARRRLNLVLAALVPVITFFPLQSAADWLLVANPVLPQQITNGVLLWAIGNGAIFLCLFWLWYRKQGASLGELGMPADRYAIVRALALAVVVCATLYLIVWLVGRVANIDFRFWVVALKAFSATQALIFLFYVLPFGAFFLVFSLSMHTQLGEASSLSATMMRNGAVASIGFLLLLALQYIPLLAGHSLFFDRPLLSIVAFQFVPLMFLVALVSTFCYDRTGNLYTGAFINTLLITWYMVAGTATQATPFWY